LLGNVPHQEVASAERRIAHQLSGKVLKAILRWRIDLTSPMSEQATLQSIARSGDRKNFPLICARRHAYLWQAIPGLLPPRLWYNHISAVGAISVTLTNAEKQARHRERHLGVDGEKVGVGLNLKAGTRAKMGRLACRRGYTIAALVEELVERAERRVTARLPFPRA
jgi:hypothetical protein